MAERRVGPQVLAVLREVAAHPGCSRYQAAAAVIGTPGYLASGDHAVQASLAGGLVKAGPSGLQLTDRGRQALAADGRIGPS